MEAAELFLELVELSQEQIFPTRPIGIQELPTPLTTILVLDLAATKDLSLSLDGFILRATKTDGWATVLADPITGEKPDVSKNVGWELDFKGSYKLAKNLTYFVEAGAFSPGAFYEDTSLVDKKRNVTQVIHGLNLTF